MVFGWINHENLGLQNQQIQRFLWYRRSVCDEENHDISQLGEFAKVCVQQNYETEDDPVNPFPLAMSGTPHGTNEGTSRCMAGWVPPPAENISYYGNGDYDTIT